MNKYHTGILSISMLITGCASLQESMLLGGTLGGGIGIGIGLAADEGGAGGGALGAGIGVLTGLAVGYLGHKGKVEKEAILNKLTKKNDEKQEYPVLREPEASCTQVEASIEGNRYIGPHISCQIEKPAVWTR